MIARADLKSYKLRFAEFEYEQLQLPVELLHKGLINLTVTL